MAKIPLAWLQLTKEKVRLLVALAGIGFADILMFMQLGFRDALFESAITFHKNVRGDIFLISSQSTALIAMKSFSQRRLYQAKAFEGVESITPVYLGFGIWKNPENRKTRQLMVIAFNPAAQFFNLPGIAENLEKVKIPDVVLFDSASREEFGPVEKLFNSGQTVETEIDSRRVRVGGLFKLGASFGADGNVVTSDLNFLRIFSRRDRGSIDIGVINLKPDVNKAQIITNMKNYYKNAYPDVLVLSHEEFIQFEKKYWETGTSIGFVFFLGTTMGFIVGTVIVYQILYTDVADHLAEYATLKAMGYKDLYLLGVVFQEAIILSILGFIPGYGVATVLYTLTRNATSLPMVMTIARAVTVLVLTVIMCTISGAIAVRKLQAADPADIF
ncbi:ABC transporter permease DevC [Microseira wollei]|uniref:Glycolipid ABC exporter (DevE) family, permease protein n=1 Tax=Microseira wollei NIES-4236 TaxID=2530354 RepID=A0AAV3X6S4_9CYAN|nr:ABC transporter permease DevC [Microseira wollei]GET35917.1 putative glycolipid ABC exporter (DevE) family, permease protein [Microseira wollei NIES-4236]